MSDAPSGSGSGPPSKAIGSLAKKQADVTRQGTQKLKFVPTLPARRKKDEVKAEPSTSAAPAASSDRGRGRGRGEGRGRGRGRGAPRPPVEMTASGPFAMGPALAGNNARRTAPRSNFTPIAVPSASGSSSLGAGLSRTAAPTLKQELGGDKGKEKRDPDDEEVYSDPDEGVVIVDMEDVRQMDWMAPESLRKDRHHKKVKKEEPSSAAAHDEVDMANALDLSESEEEEELEDIIEDFATQEADLDVDPSLREERLYFFQFPSPFPTFLPKNSVPESPMEVDLPDVPGKKVSFVGDIKPTIPTSDSSRSSTVPTESGQKEAKDSDTKIDGVIGQLEIYRSGVVKMRLANGILLDVSAATQPSFLQQAVHLDLSQKRLSILGEVNKRFVVSPDVETLLSAMEKAEHTPLVLDGEHDLIKIDS